MLERPELWLSPRFDGLLLGHGPGAVRHVLDAATRAPAGRARYARRSWAAAWRTSEALRVEEGADLSLLCSVRRPPWWRHGVWVLDADEQPVAHWRGTVLELVREGSRATVHADAGGGAGRVWVAGATAAEWAAGGGGARVRF